MTIMKKPLLLLLSLSTCCGATTYPVKRMEGTILYINKNRTGMRLSSAGKIVTVEIGELSSVRTYENQLAPDVLNVGDEVCLFEKGKTRVVYDRATTGFITRKNPLTFESKVYLNYQDKEPQEGTFPVGDYASVEVKKLPIPRNQHYRPDASYGFPSHLQTYTIINSERVEFTRFRRRALSDLAAKQNVSVYVAVLPNRRFRSRGIAILLNPAAKQRAPIAPDR